MSGTWVGGTESFQVGASSPRGIRSITVAVDGVRQDGQSLPVLLAGAAAMPESAVRWGSLSRRQALPMVYTRRRCRRLIATAR